MTPQQLKTIEQALLIVQGNKTPARSKIKKPKKITFDSLVRENLKMKNFPYGS